VRPDLAQILDEARAQIARGDEPDVAALEARIRTVDEAGVVQLRRLLAVHRAKRSLADPPQPAAPRPRAASPAYRAKPTISANMTIRARRAGDAVALEWDAVRGVADWEARIGDRPNARSPYVDRDRLTLTSPRVELRLTELPQRIAITGRNAAGRIVQRALVSGLTSSNWNQKWQQRASAS
jgi:hypothetical protein